MKTRIFRFSIPVVCFFILAVFSGCDSLFIADGDTEKGISPMGGYFYLVDTGAYRLCMLDPEFNVLKSWDTGLLSRYDEVRGIAFDGRYFWLSVATDQDSIYKVAAFGDTLIVLASFAAPPEEKGVIRDLAWDGSYLWAMNSGSETDSLPARLYKIDPASFQILGEYDLPSPEPRALTYVASSANVYGYGPAQGFYYTDVETGFIYSYDPVKRIGAQYLAAPEPPQGTSYISPVGLAWDSQEFWIVNTSSLMDYLYGIDYKGIEKIRIELPFRDPGPIAWSRSDPRVSIPTVDAVMPNVGIPGDTVAVSISGAWFLPGNGLRIEFGAGIDVLEDSTVYVSDSRLRAVIVIDPGAALGTRDVSVINPNGKIGVGYSLFTVASYDPNDGFIWMGDQSNGILSKIRISDGVVAQQWDVGAFSASNSITGLAFDGTHMWMSMSGTEDKIFQLNTDEADLSYITAIPAPPGTPDGVVREIAFDDAGALWALNSDETDAVQNIYKLDKTTGAILETIGVPGVGARGIAFAQGKLYCNDITLDNVYIYDFASGMWSAVFEMPIPPGGGTGNRYSTGMTWDGFNLWLASSTNEFDYIFQTTLTGEVLKTITSPNLGSAQITGLAFTAE